MSSVNDQLAMQGQIKLEPNYLVLEDNEEEDDDDDEDIMIVYDKNIEPYYSSLLSMFPNVNSEYIRQICIDPPFNSNADNHMQMLADHLINYSDSDQTDRSNNSEIVEDQDEMMQVLDSEEKNSDEILTQLLQQQDQERMEIERQNEEKTNELLFAEYLKQDQEAVDEKMTILENILPDADPEYLRNYVQNNHENDVSMEEFVESSIINRNYQKRDKYYAKIKTQEKIEQYTTGFTVEGFVEQFPEPFEYFENIEKQGAFQEEAFNFLKSRYPNYPERYLTTIYAMNNHNLSLADQQIQLVAAPGDTMVLDNIKVDNTALLQEIAFIQNKPSIKLHLDHLKKKDEEELETLRANELLLECQCCYDELKPTECIECDNSHIFCRRCVVKGTNLVISNSQTSVKCFVGCDKEISLNVLRKILPESTFEMLLNKRQEAEVEAAQLDGLVTCPFCPYQMELAPQITIFTCKNPECMKITCRSCKKMNHLPIKCEDVLDEHKGRLFIEEQMSKALIRTCHKCQRPFIKTVGCNMMTCLCGATMCYICRQPFTRGISHAKCARHPDSLTFDQRQVEATRAEATAKLRHDFPDMEIPKV